MARVAAVTFFFVSALAMPAWARDTPRETPAQACVHAFERGGEKREQASLHAARLEFVACAAEICPKLLRIDCARQIDEIDSSTPSVVVGAKDGRGLDLFEFQVTVDGQPVPETRSGKPVSLDPGAHLFRFERVAPAAQIRELKVLLKTGERNRPVVALFDGPPPPAPAPALVAAGPPASGEPRASSVSGGAWVFGGVGVVALGVFGTFAILGANEKAGLRDSCGNACSDEQISTLRREFLVADVALGVGVVALGVATVYLLTRH